MRNDDWKLFTDKPTQAEIGKITISPRITDAVINIPPRKCNISYGPVVYGLEIVQGMNSSRQISLIDQNNYTWKQLQPYTNYTLAFQTARTIKSLNDTSMRVVKYYNFTTKPDGTCITSIEKSACTQLMFLFQCRLRQNPSKYMKLERNWHLSDINYRRKQMDNRRLYKLEHVLEFCQNALKTSRL